MSTSSSSSNSLFDVHVSEKLMRQNFMLWAVQVLTTIWGARLEGYITDKSITPNTKITSKVVDKDVKIPNPAYEEWYATDQQVLGFLFASLSRDVLSQVAAARTAAQTWRMIQDMYASQTRTRAINLRLAMTTT